MEAKLDASELEARWREILGQEDSWLSEATERFPRVSGALGILVLRTARKITRTRNPRPCQLLFELARQLRGYALDEEGVEPVEYWEPILMYREVLAALGYKAPLAEMGVQDNGTLWAEFLSCWEKVKIPDRDRMSKAQSLAIAEPITLKVNVEDPSGGAFARQLEQVASLGYHLQVMVGDEDIFMPVQAVGEFCGANVRGAAMTGSRILERACKLGLFTVTNDRFGAGRCKRKRFNLDRIDLYEEHLRVNEESEEPDEVDGRSN